MTQTWKMFESKCHDLHVLTREFIILAIIRFFLFLMALCDASKHDPNTVILPECKAAVECFYWVR